MDPEKLLIYAQVAIGIGLVIFVHELGHFLAARLCGVRVEVFSLGFGPRVLGRRIGATLYQVAVIRGFNDKKAKAYAASAVHLASPKTLRNFVRSGAIKWKVAKPAVRTRSL